MRFFWQRTAEFDEVAKVAEESRDALREVADVIIELRTTARELKQTLKELSEDTSSG